MTSAQETILVVDDEEIWRQLLTIHLEANGFAVVEASNGQEALDTITQNTHRFNVILLDRLMPGMDGIEVLKTIKSDRRFKDTPIVMQTAAAKEEDIIEGISSGAYYYLTKPFDPELMLSVVQAASSDSRRHRALSNELEKSSKLMRFFDSGTFSCSKPESASQLAGLLASACPDPESVVIGLSELILNGIEHGNLQIDYEKKSQLTQNGEWVDEIRRIQNLPENINKRVRVTATRNDDSIEFKIQDQGNGFDWQEFMELNPSRAYDLHGRGIALSKTMSFDSLTYENNGTLAIATVSQN